MNSRTTTRFWDCYKRLPQNIKERAQKAYSLFIDDHRHPSLRFKKVLDNPMVYSVRITGSYRALGVRKANTIIWYMMITSRC